jgi:hypothetical protein
MASTPPPEFTDPEPIAPREQPGTPGHEVDAPDGDRDQPAPPIPGASPPLPADRADPRPDIQQVVEARSDAVARGEGGPEPETFTAPGLEDGVGGTGGRVKNQDDTAQ